MEDIKAFVMENKKQFLLFEIISAGLLLMTAGIIIWKLPMAAVCVFVLLEAGLAACLQNLPVWFHGMILIAQLLTGLLCGNGIFILASTLFYIISILSFRFLNESFSEEK